MGDVCSARVVYQEVALFEGESPEETDRMRKNVKALKKVECNVETILHKISRRWVPIKCDR